MRFDEEAKLWRAMLWRADGLWEVESCVVCVGVVVLGKADAAELLAFRVL